MVFITGTAPILHPAWSTWMLWQLVTASGSAAVAYLLAHLFWRDRLHPGKIVWGNDNLSSKPVAKRVPLLAWGCAWDKRNIRWDHVHSHSDQRGPKPSTYSWPALRPHLHRRDAEEARRKRSQEKNLKQLERWIWCPPHTEIRQQRTETYWLKRLECSLQSLSCLITVDH